ncbi:SCF ubiquitin ligase complex subunit cdc4 [Ophidiomyces ophidiicola]|nr:SCF ubiquitin ligase complex subunit cdc4 [Ophidiomyces ophidiicola]
MATGDASQHPVKSPEKLRPAYPSNFDHVNHNAILPADPPTEPTLGQFSFAPTTQTTIVTTTTTTTTNFPPLVMRVPRLVDSLDPKEYPLASAPTPASLRDIKFNLNGQSILFHEPSDAASTLAELSRRQEDLNAANGTIRSIKTIIDNPSLRPEPHTISLVAPRQSATLNTRRRRPVSPIPFAPSERRTVSGPSQSGIIYDAPVSQLPGHIYQSVAGLATPETENVSFSLNTGKQESKKVPQSGSANIQRNEDSPAPIDDNRQSSGSDSVDSPLLNRRTGLGRMCFVPPMPSSIDSPGQPRRPRPAISRLAAVDQNNADIPLPSPRLSPVAALSTSQQEISFDSVEDQTDPDDPDFGAENEADARNTASCAERGGTPFSQQLEKQRDDDASPPALSLMDIPTMLNYFESIPDGLKSYVMYQLLRRCPKPTLHLVADVVNPALKCDFLVRLPAELSLNVVKFLDVRSMCRASQVSKKWRQIIDSDEKTWRDHFDAAGFTLPQEELDRAILEGWGWQYADDCERDLRTSSTWKKRGSDLSNREVARRSSDIEELAFYRKSKRKAPSHSPSRKSAKKQALECRVSDQVRCVNWPRDSKIEGPLMAASAAASAIPFPDIGLPTLRNLHLYKSLYQRHHQIRNAWMDSDATPLHLAFRAHDRHVVTCLQFDTDKILTGSDDTNIHVYDTKTGALRGTLEGHEGGVWALEYYGSTLVSGSTDRSVRVWDIDRAECTQVFHGHTSTVRCLKILLPTEVGQLPDGSPEIMPKEPLIITGSRDASLRVWRLPQPGDEKFFQSVADDPSCPYFIRVMTGHAHSVRAIAAHGDTLVSGSYDCTVRVWKISTGESIHRLEGHSYKVYSVALDYKRNRCISGSMDYLVKIWSLENGSLLYNLEGHTSLVGLLDLQADKLVSAAADSTLRIWDPETGKCKSTLSAHTGAITCFEHDGQKIISGSDRTLKMWNIQTGEWMKDLLTGLSGVWQVLDFGASRDRAPAERLGKRIVVDKYGEEVQENNEEGDEGDGSNEQP